MNDKDYKIISNGMPKCKTLGEERFTNFLSSNHVYNPILVLVID